MTIKGGALEFDIIANNGQINNALDETKKRVQGFTDATVEGGEKMELAFKDAADTIDKAFADIDSMAGIHQTAIRGLEKQYQELGTAAAAAFAKGTDKGDKEYNALVQKQKAISQELKTRKALLREVEATADELLKEEQTLKKTKEAVDNNAKAHGMLRTQLMNAKNTLAEMEEAGQRGTAAYREMQKEVGRLQNAMGDANMQAKIMSHDNAGLQGVISAVSGVAGAFSAAQGAIGLFAGENENLQKVMLKVQSLMAITMGLQQVANTINKDSYFTIVLLGGIKSWWADVVAKSTKTETANTAATIANTAAKKAQAGVTTAATGAEAANTVATGAQAVAAKAGTLANIGLAGAFRLVGTAIKSIPVFGWILAGVSALIGLVSGLTKKSREAKKAAEELRKEVVEIAGKPIAAIQELSNAWDKLGDNLDAKKKFVEENAEKFKELGVSVKSVEEAENVLNNNKEAFINSEIAKAKAMAVRAQAADLVAKALENQQKLEEERKTPTKTRYVPGDPMTGIGGYTYEVANPKIAKFEERDKEYQQQITALYTNAANYELEGLKILEEAGIQGTKEYAEGTVGALEQVISTKQALLKDLSDPEAYKAALAEIEAIQKQVDAITGGTKKTTTTKTTDPFTNMLDERKKKYQQYLKWVNSSDEIVRNAAKTEFAGLLAEGSSYLDYLKKQREQLLELSNHTPAQLQNLAKLNDEIAAETKNTVLGQFEQELQTQLSGARSIMEMLNILEERRRQLAGDGSDLDNSKAQVLDNAQADVAKQAEEETNAMLQQYSSYLSAKLEFEVQYGEKRRLLNERLAKATTEDERRIVLAALEGLEKDREEYANRTGNEDYDKLVEEFRSYAQRRADISAEYDEKIALATEQQNAELVQRLIEAKNKAVSSVALEELQDSSAWENLFSNLDELTAEQITILVDEIERQFDSLAGKFNPIDIATVRDKLNEAKAILIQDNPFKQVGEAIRAIFNDAGEDSKDSATKIKKNWKNLADATEASFDFVQDAISSCEFLKDAIGEIGATAISSLATVAATSIAVATAIKTAEKASVVLAIIQAALVVVQAVANVFKSIFGNQDKKIEKSIQKHAEAVNVLERAYNQLAWAIDNALGETVYKNQEAAIQNMRQQQAHLQQMWQKEQSKKKTDKGKVNEYKEQYAQLGREIEDMIAEIAANITQTTAKDLADELADAIVDAFSKGEDAAQAFEKTAKEVMQNAVKNALKLQFLEKPLQSAIARLQRDMGFDSEGNGSFDGLTAAEQQRFKNAIASIGANFAEAMKLYEDLFREIEEAGDPTTSLSGAIKGASQESIDLLAGQTNAVRINQVQGIEIMRQQLFHLANIDAKVGTSNRYLQNIDNKMSSNNYDPLRSQGLTS